MYSIIQVDILKLKFTPEENTDFIFVSVDYIDIIIIAIVLVLLFFGIKYIVRRIRKRSNQDADLNY